MSVYSILNEVKPIRGVTKTAAQYYNLSLKEKCLTLTALYPVMHALSEKEKFSVSIILDDIIARDISQAILQLHRWSFTPPEDDDGIFDYHMKTDFENLLEVLEFFEHPASATMRKVYNHKRSRETK